MKSFRFKCSVEYAKRSFYRSAIVGRLASEEVVLQLLLMKCVPILVYGLELHCGAKKLHRFIFAISLSKQGIF